MALQHGSPNKIGQERTKNDNDGYRIEQQKMNSNSQLPKELCLTTTKSSHLPPPFFLLSQPNPRFKALHIQPWPARRWPPAAFVAAPAAFVAARDFRPPRRSSSPWRTRLRCNRFSLQCFAKSFVSALLRFAQVFGAVS